MVREPRGVECKVKKKHKQKLSVYLKGNGSFNLNDHNDNFQVCQNGGFTKCRTNDYQSVKYWVESYHRLTGGK